MKYYKLKSGVGLPTGELLLKLLNVFDIIYRETDSVHGMAIKDYLESLVEVPETDWVQQEIDAGRLTSLPKYWCVKNDGSKLFKDTVIKYLNDKYNSNWAGVEKLSFYGYDGNIRNHSRTNFWEDKLDFENNPIELTINQFIKLSGCNDKKETGFNPAKIVTTTFEKVLSSMVKHPKAKYALGELFPELKDCTFKVGDTFEINGGKWKLMPITIDKVPHVVMTKHIDTGHYDFTEIHFPVKDFNRITYSEIEPGLKELMERPPEKKEDKKEVLCADCKFCASAPTSIFPLPTVCSNPSTIFSAIFAEQRSYCPLFQKKEERVCANCKHCVKGKCAQPSCLNPLSYFWVTDCRSSCEYFEKKEEKPEPECKFKVGEILDICGCRCRICDADKHNAYIWNITNGGISDDFYVNDPKSITIPEINHAIDQIIDLENARKKREQEKIEREKAKKEITFSIGDIFRSKDGCEYMLIESNLASAVRFANIKTGLIVTVSVFVKDIRKITFSEIKREMEILGIDVEKYSKSEELFYEKLNKEALEGWRTTECARQRAHQRATAYFVGIDWSN